MTESRVIAALDLACMLQVLSTRHPALAADDRIKLRRYTVRGMAALNGSRLPAGEAIDLSTGLAAFDAICSALISIGISNAELAAHFNRGAVSRINPARAS